LVSAEYSFLFIPKASWNICSLALLWVLGSYAIKYSYKFILIARNELKIKASNYLSSLNQHSYFWFYYCHNPTMINDKPKNNHNF